MKKMIAAAAALSALAVALPAQANEDAFKKAGCNACHAPDKKVVGPSLKDIAAKYKGQADAPTKLADKARKGGSGAWGTIPMPPNPASKINDADLKAVIDWILKR